MPELANPNVVHESEAQRQHVRVRLPGIIEFTAGREHCRFRLHDLSAGGLSFEAPGKTFQVGDAFKGNLILNVDAIAIALAVGFTVRNFEPKSGRTGCAFADLGPKEIATLRRIIGAFLSGELVGVGDVLHTLGRDNFTKARGNKAPAREQRSVLGRLSSMLMTFLFLCAGVLAFAYTAKQVNRLLFMTTAVAAKVSGPVYTIAMPREGTFYSLVPPDGIVQKGAAIAQFESPVFDLVRNQAEAVNITPEMLQKMMGMTVKGTITSPCDCRVQAAFVTDAQYVARGQPLFELMPKQFSPYVIARFRYDQVEQLVAGTPVHFNVAGDHSDRTGRIAQVRAPGQADTVESDVIVIVQPDEPLSPTLLSRPAQVMAGSGVLSLPRGFPLFGARSAGAAQ